MTRLCPILEYDAFESMFAGIGESFAKRLFGKKFSILEWYENGGMEKLRNLEWENNVAGKLGIGRGKTLDSLTSYLSRMSDTSDGEWLDAAKAVIRRELAGEFSFVGQGSLKVCLFSKDGYALKFGRNGDSLRTEITNNLKYGKYGCVPKMIAYDRETFKSYICEFARESVDGDFRKIYGTANANKFLDGVMNGSGLDEYLLGMRKMIDECGLFDISSNNMGVAVRDGKRQIVLIDYDL